MFFLLADPGRCFVVCLWECHCVTAGFRPGPSWIPSFSKFSSGSKHDMRTTWCEITLLTSQQSGLWHFPHFSSFQSLTAQAILNLEINRHKHDKGQYLCLMLVLFRKAARGNARSNLNSSTAPSFGFPRGILLFSLFISLSRCLFNFQKFTLSWMIWKKSLHDQMQISLSDQATPAEPCDYREFHFLLHFYYKDQQAWGLSKP